MSSRYQKNSTPSFENQRFFEAAKAGASFWENENLKALRILLKKTKKSIKNKVRMSEICGFLSPDLIVRLSQSGDQSRAKIQ
ncbi:MAG: hypothetical protein J5825_07905 [Lachnospiraceae bacterium]|nr:hypothetical protein [Lachnospiraceae bacterium]